MISDNFRSVEENHEMKLLKDNWKKFFLIAGFYAINFGVWELIAIIVSSKWAFFLVYAALFIVVLAVFHKELLKEWKDIKVYQLKDRKFHLNLALWFVADLVFTTLLLYIAAKTGWDILTGNNENVKTQMASVPIALTVI